MDDLENDGGQAQSLRQHNAAGTDAADIATKLEEWLSRAEDNTAFKRLVEANEILQELQQLVACLEYEGREKLAARLDSASQELAGAVGEWGCAMAEPEIPAESQGDLETDLLNRAFGRTNHTDAMNAVRTGIGLLRPLLLAVAGGAGRATRGMAPVVTRAGRTVSGYEWARQAELVRATNQVLGQGTLDKGVLSRACSDRHVETNGKSGRGLRVRVSGFLPWVARKFSLAKDEQTQIRNAIFGEINERNS
jgi:hypothetical protein